MSLFCEHAAESGDMARNRIRAILHGVSVKRHYQCVRLQDPEDGLWVVGVVQFDATYESCQAHVIGHLANKNLDGHPSDKCQFSISCPKRVQQALNVTFHWTVQVLSSAPSDWEAC